jgi:hypothetical protein
LIKKEVTSDIKHAYPTGPADESKKIDTESSAENSQTLEDLMKKLKKL